MAQALTPEQWVAIREAWNRRAAVANSLTGITAFAREMGISRQAISERQKRDRLAGSPWPIPLKAAPPPPPPIGSEGAAEATNVINFDRDRAHKTKTGHAPRESSRARFLPSALDDTPLPEEVENGLIGTDDHEHLALLCVLAAKRVMRKIARGEVEPGLQQSLADVIETGVRVSKIAIDNHRKVLGRKPGEPSNVPPPSTEDQRGFVVVQRRLEPVRVPIDDQGRVIEASAVS